MPPTPGSKFVIEEGEQPMVNEELNGVIGQLRDRRIDRRRLMQGAAAVGASTSGLGLALTQLGATDAVAQDEAPLVTVSQEQVATWIRNFNPLMPEGSTARWPTQAGIYEPMIVYNTAKGEILPWLATEYAYSEDSKTLTFTTREGVNWSDGTPFTANDVAFTFNLLLENEGLTGSGAVRAALAFVTDVQAPDDKTVVFTFSQAFTPGLYDIGEQTIVPEHLWKDVTDPVTFTNENPVGTGPFTDVKVFEAQYWELHKNPSYWQEGKPYVQGFRFPAYSSNDAANLATVNGENDWAANFIPDVQKTYISKDEENNHYWFPPFGADVHLYTNTTKAPFDNVDVRKAISMALDREKMVSIAMYDYTHPADATGLSDAYERWKNQAAVDAGKAWVSLDVDAANALLDAAGLTREGDGTRMLEDETPMKYDLNVVSGWSDWVSACQIMAENLKEIGIEASVKTYEVAAWQERVQKGEFDLSIGWSSGGPTPFNYYRGQMSSKTAEPVGTVGNENWHRFASEEADTLLDQFATASEFDEQKAIADQLQMLYAENAPAIPLFPGPQWGEFNTKRFTDFPSEENPYAILSTYENPDRLIVMTTIKPKE